MFETIEKGNSTVQATVRCYRSMRKNEAPHGLSFDWDTARQKITKNNTTRYLPENEGQTDTLKTKTGAKQRKKLNVNACGKKAKNESN